MILLIDNYDSFTHNLFQSIVFHDQNVIIKRNDQISIKQIEKMNVKGIILSPGPGRPENSGICLNVIRQLGSKIPILGVCLGHQAIALAFGGEVVAAPKILHGKESSISHFEGILFKGVSNPFKAGRYHSLIVSKETFSKELKIDAIDESGEIMALSHCSHHIYGVQFHPESIMTPEGKKITKNFVKICNNQCINSSI